MPNNTIEQRIKEYVQELCAKRELPDTTNYIETDSIGEVIDKLVIMHIRLWMLEDQISPEMSDEELGRIKRKIDICFKQKRPKLVEAINKLINKSVQEGISLEEDSVKEYKSNE
jgi:hypothetical protein